MKALFPPSSRNTFFTVSLAAAMMRRPTGVDPVNVTMSTSEWVVRHSPTAVDEDDRMLATPAGISVSSAMSLPRANADHGVSGAPLSTTVHPAARAGTSFARLIWVGKL